MATRANGTVETKTWDEQTYSEVDCGPKLTTTTGVDNYHGDLEATATYAGITVYETSGAATFTSVLRIEGSIGGKTGTFVLELDGTVDETGATAGSWKVRPNSGTGELKKIRGNGSLTYAETENSFTLDYDLN
jgi:Protein of unknown function (DUF3224)